MGLFDTHLQIAAYEIFITLHSFCQSHPATSFLSNEAENNIFETFFFRGFVVLK